MAKVLWVLILAAIGYQARGFGLGDSHRESLQDSVSNSTTDDENPFKCKDELYRNPLNCSSFIQCSNGIEYIMPCPEGLHYSAEKERCEKPCDARCDRTYACRCGWDTCEQGCLLEKRSGWCGWKSASYYFETSMPFYYKRYYYNKLSAKCELFKYMGCSGNENNFLSIKECDNKCNKRNPPGDSTDICRLPKENGPCDGHFTRYFFNHNTGRCEQFVYGGCKGNPNNFLTRSQCEGKCLKTLHTENQEDSIDICRLPKDKGPCDFEIKKYFFNPEKGECEPFVYGGCLGNSNLFDDKHKCEQKCLRTQYTEEQSNLGVAICRLPRDPGPCKGRYHRFFYNRDRNRCIQFDYGGCQGNANNFETKRICEIKCLRDMASTETCSLPAERGTCHGRFPRYYFDKSTGQCTLFVYRGCNGNDNNFETKQDCEKSCAHTVDVCQLPKAEGLCQASFTKWWYNPDSKKCEQFTYSGCRGNGNNFDSERECEERCSGSQNEEDDSLERYKFKCEKDGLYPHRKNCSAFIQCTNGRPVIMSCPNLLHYSPKTERCELPCDAHCDRSLACGCNWDTCDIEPECDSPPVKGPCNEDLPKFYYDKKERKCKEFLYGGCGGNGNNYDTIDLCQLNCLNHFAEVADDSTMVTELSRAVPEYCELPPETGRCHANITKFYYDHEEGECKEFQYGGCGGNRNSFYSKWLCERKCKDKSAPEETEDSIMVAEFSQAVPEYCELPPETGRCHANITKFYYDHEEGECKEFQYGGCGGNRNSFYSKELCERKCKDKSVPEEAEDSIMVAEFSQAVPEYCELPPETGRCHANITKFYYDHEEGECKEFQYGGCGGNRNSFYSKELCERKCKDKSVPEEAEDSIMVAEFSQAVPEYCELPPETGRCHANITKFYYDHEEGECKEFQYGGCGGNRNSFYSKELCERKCKDKSVPEEAEDSVMVEEFSQAVPEYCELPPVTGRCHAKITKFYYDHEEGECKEFQYGGCGGNRNSFYSKELCERKCKDKSVPEEADDSIMVAELSQAVPEYCELPPEIGPCPAKIPKFYYDHEEGECKGFQFGGCLGNRNNFYSKEQCERYCKDKSAPELECIEENGDFYYRRNCSLFIRCRNGVPELKKCPDGGEFDFVDRVCVEAKTARCVR